MEKFVSCLICLEQGFCVATPNLWNSLPNGIHTQVRCQASVPIWKQLSVCLSLTRVDQSKTVEVRIMKFLLYGSPMTNFCKGQTKAGSGPEALVIPRPLQANRQG